MKIAFITNLRAPYRTLQLNEYGNLENVSLTAYYTDRANENRKWNLHNADKFKEVDLKGYKILKKYGYINSGIIKIVKENDLIILGCYEQPTYIVISILCRIFNKKYILSFDGISTDRLYKKENILKKYIKKIVINKAIYIMGNGLVSKGYFNKQFNYPNERILNQFLTVDSNVINSLYEKKEKFRHYYRKKYNIRENEKVIIYSGRLIDIKNIDSVIKALSKVNGEKITFLIIGGGYLESNLKELANRLKVKIVFTGFIETQEELFKHYFIGDSLILPSLYEPWGLVVNEAMFSGLPVIVSKICGCSLDLVENGVNGYIINPDDINDIKNAIEDLFFKDDIKLMGQNSRSIIKEWTFINSKKNLSKIIDNLNA